MTPSDGRDAELLALADECMQAFRNSQDIRKKNIALRKASEALRSATLPSPVDNSSREAEAFFAGLDDLDHEYRLAQESPTGVITSAELLKRSGVNLSKPFDRGPFPPEMRQSESLADKLERLCCAETEGQFFDCVTDNISEIITVLRLAANPPDPDPMNDKRAGEDARLAAKVREALENIADWCSTERANIGAIDGYDYWSGEEFGLRCAEIEIRKRAALSPPSPGERK